VSLGAQVTLTNQSTFGGNEFEHPASALSAADGGFYLLCTTMSSSSGNVTVTNYGEEDFILVKYDANHVIEWQNNYGGTDRDVAYDIYRVGNDLMLVGISKSPVSGNKTASKFGDWDVWIVKTDLDGNKLWDKTFGGDNSDILKASDQLNNGNLILAVSSFSGISGNKTTSNAGLADYWIFEIDENGDYVWEKTLGTDKQDTPDDIVYFDNNIYISGTSTGEVNGDKTEPLYGFSDYWIVKTDATGNKIWDRAIGSNGVNGYMSKLYVDADSMQIFNLGNNPMSGMRNVPLKGEQDIWRVSLSHSGDVLSQKSYGGNLRESVHSLLELNGNLLLLASSNSDISLDKTENSKGDTDFWPILINQNGDIIWQKTIGGNQADGLGSYALRPNGKLLVSLPSESPVSGDKTSPNYGGFDTWVIELDITVLSDKNATFQNFTVYPNPFKDNIVLSGENMENIKKVEITDATGRVVASKRVSTAFNNSISISTENVANGSYILNVTTINSVQSYKVLK
jgi:hypothetical protein